MSAQSGVEATMADRGAGADLVSFGFSAALNLGSRTEKRFMRIEAMVMTGEVKG
jgi:hypothetical protein